MDIFIGLIIFAAGVSFGFYVRGVIFSSLEWNLLKWDKEVFAYRPAQKGAVIKKDEKVFMALRVPTSNVPTEGYKYE